MSEHSVYQCVINLRSGRESLQGQEGEGQEDKKRESSFLELSCLCISSHIGAMRSQTYAIMTPEQYPGGFWVFELRFSLSAQQAHLQHCIFCVACSSRIHPWKNKVDIMYQNKDLTQYNTVSYNMSNCTMKKIFITQEKQNKI